LVVAPLEETQGLLSRFDCVYSGYITQGDAEGALVGCYEPTAQVLLLRCTTGTGIGISDNNRFLRHRDAPICKDHHTGTSRYRYLAAISCH